MPSSHAPASFSTQLTDPLGRTFTLHDATWSKHILRGHPELKRTGSRHLVEQAIRTPREIRMSNSDPDCRLYFGAGPKAGLLVQVVVDVVRGLVLTAHLARRYSGGICEWSSSKP